MSLLDTMKEQCKGLEGIYCEKTEENKELLINEGYKVWGDEDDTKQDIIYVIDTADIEKEFIEFNNIRDNYKYRYRPFSFIEGVPTFIDEEKMKKYKIVVPKDIRDLRNNPLIRSVELVTDLGVSTMYSISRLLDIELKEFSEDNINLVPVPKEWIQEIITTEEFVLSLKGKIVKALEDNDTIVVILATDNQKYLFEFSYNYNGYEINNYCSKGIGSIDSLVDRIFKIYKNYDYNVESLFLKWNDNIANSYQVVHKYYIYPKYDEVFKREISGAGNISSWIDKKQLEELLQDYQDYQVLSSSSNRLTNDFINKSLQELDKEFEHNKLGELNG